MPKAEEVPFEIVIRGIESRNVSVEGFANFLRDLVFLHDRLWIVASGRSLEYDISTRYFYTRRGRPLPDNQKLRLTFVKQGSPFEVGFIIQSGVFVASTAWVFVQIIRALCLLPGEKKKQELEIEGLEAKKEERKKQAIAAVHVASNELAREEFSQRGNRETELRLLQRDIKRISEDELSITEVEVIRTTKTKEK